MYEVQFYDTVQSYPQFLTMIVVFFGALFLGNGTLDVPVLVTFLLYVGSLSEPITLLLNFMRLYEEGKAGFLRFSEMMDVQPAITQSSSPVTLPDGPKSVEFDDVSFRYDEAAEDVLRHVSFTVPAGQTAAFVGASGIGKTTVCSLIARFYDATGGSVRIGGTDVRELSFESLRRTVGIVQQEVCLFNGTIRATSATAVPMLPTRKWNAPRPVRICMISFSLCRRDMTPSWEQRASASPAGSVSV